MKRLAIITTLIAVPFLLVASVATTAQAAKTQQDADTQAQECGDMQSDMWDVYENTDPAIQAMESEYDAAWWACPLFVLHFPCSEDWAIGCQNRNDANSEFAEGMDYMNDANTQQDIAQTYYLYQDWDNACYAYDAAEVLYDIARLKFIGAGNHAATATPCFTAIIGRHS